MIAGAICLATAATFVGAKPAFAGLELDQSAFVVADSATMGAVNLLFGTFKGGMPDAAYTGYVQGVTAGKSGALDHIDVQLVALEGWQPDYDPGGLVTLRLYDGDLAAGPANQIAKQSISIVDLPGQYSDGAVPTTYVDFDVRSANFIVNAGQHFSFSFDFISNTGPGLIGAITGRVQAETGSDFVLDYNHYAGGQLNWMASTIEGIGPAFDGDVGFRTFVDVTAGAVPEPASWTTMLGGFGILGGALRHRGRKVRCIART